MFYYCLVGCLLIFITALNLVYQWSFSNKQILLFLCRKGTKIKVYQIHSKILLCHIFCHFSGTNYFSGLTSVLRSNSPNLFCLLFFFKKAVLVPGRTALNFCSSQEGTWVGSRCYCVPPHLIAWLRGKRISFHKEGLCSAWAGRAAAGLQALWWTFWHRTLCLLSLLYTFVINIFLLMLLFLDSLLFPVNCSYSHWSLPFVPLILLSSP